MTTLTICQNCKSSCSESDRFCPSCGHSQKGLVQSPRSARSVQQAEKLDSIRDDRRSLDSHAFPSQVGHTTNLNVAPHQGTATLPNGQTINVHVSSPGATAVESPAEDSTFAILTLIMYFLIFPIGGLMNLVGLIAGPHRGAHALMFFLIGLPTVVVTGGLVALMIAAAVAGA